MRLTYKQAVADIVRISSTGNAPKTQQEVKDLCQVFSEFLAKFTEQTNGYMILAAFNVAFAEMKNVINAAEGQDKILIEQILHAVIGSFGRTVQ
jgi:hypothetical protein